MNNSASCMICKKPLTDPLSIELGMGPVCRISRKKAEHANRDGNMFGNRAVYCWGIDGDVLWLKDMSTDTRSLTNDIENCIVEISEQLPEGTSIADYKIMYKDSDGVWDAVCLIDISTLKNDLEWLKYRGERGQEYWSKIDINFYPIQKKDYNEAKQDITTDAHYQHFNKNIGV